MQSAVSSHLDGRPGPKGSVTLILLRLIGLLGMTTYFDQGGCYFNNDIILLCIK